MINALKDRGAEGEAFLQPARGGDGLDAEFFLEGPLGVVIGQAPARFEADEGVSIAPESDVGHFIEAHADFAASLAVADDEERLRDIF